MATDVGRTAGSLHWDAAIRPTRYSGLKVTSRSYRSVTGRVVAGVLGEGEVGAGVGAGVGVGVDEAEGEDEGVPVAAGS
ncbi:hypothetical protein GCM10009741_09620 [Kribbella lupini]|uniref:Uncharacterized protein n=1 Tax=Kribbella lupini TaxID=291602 RepID=A0ABP4KZT7_9ACTN